MFNVRLENFEGPLDLLLYFIKRDKIDIYDIPISKITSEYIDVINTAKKLDVSIAGEFLFMASLLLRLKTRMLLPRQQDEEGLDIDDPRINLVGQLLQYKNFRNIAHQLKGIHEENKDIFYRPNDKISFEKTRGFSDMLYGEDIDLTFRLWENGFETQFIEEAFVYHKRRSTISRFFKQTFNFGAARPILNKKHPKSAKLTYWFPSLFIIGFDIALILLIFGKWIYIIPFLGYFVILFFDSLLQNKNFKVAFLSIITTYTQFLGYGLGFLKSSFKL